VLLCEFLNNFNSAVWIEKLWQKIRTRTVVGEAWWTTKESISTMIQTASTHAPQLALTSSLGICAVALIKLSSGERSTNRRLPPTRLLAKDIRELHKLLSLTRRLNSLQRIERSSFAGRRRILWERWALKISKIRPHLKPLLHPNNLKVKLSSRHQALLPSQLLIADMLIIAKSASLRKSFLLSFQVKPSQILLWLSKKSVWKHQTRSKCLLTWHSRISHSIPT